MSKSVRAISASLLILTLLSTLFACGTMSAAAASRELSAARQVLSDGDSVLKAGSPQTGVTNDQPFPEGAGGSRNFRIPAFTVLQDGSLFAAADARYATTGDGGGLDIITAVSNDNGKTWNQNFAIWYPDSEGYAGNQATTAIDSLVVQGNDGTIFVIADMNPTGVTTMGGFTMPGYGTGYMEIDGIERLALTDDYAETNDNPHQTAYPYYMGDFSEGYARVYRTADRTPSDWVLDAWWNLYRITPSGDYQPLLQTQVNNPAQTIQQNVFYKDSVLHVYNTGYLMLTVSRDGGRTWQPEVLNPAIKRDNESALLVSPGKGTVTKDGTILIPFYNWYTEQTTLTQNASFIWSKDNGKTWHRTADTHNANDINWVSESEIVELYNGTLRMFVRNETGYLTYIDATWSERDNNYIWSDPQVTSVKITSECKLTAITYSQTIDGKLAVMIAAPTLFRRENGMIFTFLVDKDNSMKPAYRYRINRGVFGYSCMDELPDGSIGILYETEPGKMLYRSIALEDVIARRYIDMMMVIILCPTIGGIVLIAGITLIAIKICKKKKRSESRP